MSQVLRFIGMAACVVGIGLGSGIAAANDWVCVRNYTVESGQSACDLGNGSYVLARHAREETKKVCARTYAAFYCQYAREFQWIHSLEGERVCVMDYAQPGVANYCESAPQFYDYVLRD